MTIQLAGPPQPQIERTFATMALMRVVEADDHGAEFRQRQPERHLPLQNAALAATALAGDYHDEPGAAGLRGVQEAQQGIMRSRLRQPVQIEPSVDRIATARDALL